MLVNNFPTSDFYHVNTLINSNSGYSFCYADICIHEHCELISEGVCLHVVKDAGTIMTFVLTPSTKQTCTTLQLLELLIGCCFQNFYHFMINFLWFLILIRHYLKWILNFPSTETLSVSS